MFRIVIPSEARDLAFSQLASLSEAVEQIHQKKKRGRKPPFSYQKNNLPKITGFHLRSPRLPTNRLRAQHQFHILLIPRPRQNML